jgi:hypothetical protein
MHSPTSPVASRAATTDDREATARLAKAMA